MKLKRKERANKTYREEQGKKLVDSMKRRRRKNKHKRRKGARKRQKSNKRT